MPERQVITSLVGTVAPLLTIDTGDLNATASLSHFVPQGWKKTTPFVIDHVEILPNNQTGMAVEMTFEVPKLAHGIVDLVLRATLPPATITPAGNPAYYEDFLGYAMINYFRTHFGSNQVFSTEAYDLYFEHRKINHVERRDAVNELILGDTTTAQRSAALLNGVELQVDLMQPFTHCHKNMLPIVALSQKTRFQLLTHALNNLVETSVAGTTVSYGQLKPDFVLEASVIHVTANESSLLLDMSRYDDGIVYMIHHHVRQQNDEIGSLVNGYSPAIKLCGITKPIRELHWALIPSKQINNTGRNDRFFFSPTPTTAFPTALTPYNPIVSWSIEANGQIIQRTMNRNWNRVHLHSKHHSGPHGDEIFSQYYDPFPELVNCAGGYLDYTNLNNATLRPIFGTGGTGTDVDNPLIAQVLTVVVNAKDYNFWFFKNGNWSKTFN